MVKVKVMHISTVKMVTDRKNITISEKEVVYWLLICIWSWSILKVNVKDMHILMMNILEMGDI